MNIKNHFELMASYNIRMNVQVYQAASKLSNEDLTKNAGAFFGSVIGTLNHMVVCDLIWLARFKPHKDTYHSLDGLSKFPTPESLDQVLYLNFSDLEGVRVKLDAIIQRWIVDETKEDDFVEELLYKNMKGITSKRDFGELVSHLFNHQTHHRGQASTLLNQFGEDIGVTDFLIDIPDSHIVSD
ncbi:MAG: putative damage-inducible protein DinB [Gammaproteobacteria bacterium]